METFLVLQLLIILAVILAFRLVIKEILKVITDFIGTANLNFFLKKYRNT
ncbi:positive regulator of sigma E activity [Chryseobacterium sp. JUb7]|nr:positive regulator of sigma E activity [Chryseobacterium sp. JUb7]